MAGLPATACECPQPLPGAVLGRAEQLIGASGGRDEAAGGKECRQAMANTPADLWAKEVNLPRKIVVLPEALAAIREAARQAGPVQRAHAVEARHQPGFGAEHRNGPDSHDHEGAAEGSGDLAGEGGGGPSMDGHQGIEQPAVSPHCTCWQTQISHALLPNPHLAEASPMNPGAVRPAAQHRFPMGWVPLSEVCVHTDYMCYLCQMDSVTREVSTRELRSQLSDVLGRAMYAGERIGVTRNGKLAAVRGECG